jgi:ribosomal protein S18 acetylase RimI-like enzyme
MLTELFTLPDAPAIAGLSFRHIRGAEDAKALHTVQFESVAHDAVDYPAVLEDVPGSEQMSGWLSDAVTEGRQDQWLVAQVNGCVVAYTQIESWKDEWPQGDVTWVYLHVGWVLPEWRGKGFGTAMLHWAEDCIRRLATVQHPNEEIEFAANASNDEKEATALLLHEGYFVAFTILYMNLDASVPLPPPTALPAGIEVRPVLPNHLPLINASIYEAYLHEDVVRYVIHYDPTRHLAELCDPKHDPTLWLVAWEGDQIAGQVLSVFENGKGEVFQVSVRPAWRRRGLARSLLLRALHGLRARGMDDIWLDTVSEYPTHAKDLYQSVGFRVVKETPRYRKLFKCGAAIWASLPAPKHSLAQPSQEF